MSSSCVRATSSTCGRRGLSRRPPWSRASGSGGSRLRHPQVEALEKSGDRFGLHPEPVAVAELTELLRRRVRDATHVDELLEEALEAGRRDDLQDPCRLVGRVPERVPLVAWLVD